MKLYKDICSAWIDFFFIDWHCKRLKNTSLDLLLFYGEHFYGFLKSDLWKRRNKITNISVYTVTDILKFYEVLFCTYVKGLFCL